MARRIKGQEVSVTVVSATNGVEPSIADVKSMNWQYDREIKSEGYLGQTTEQKDDIFKGVSGKIDFHVRSADVFSLTDRINEVSKRRLPAESIQILFTYAFPDGGRRRIVIKDAVFGDIPFETPAREDYMTVTYNFAAEEARTLPA
jgi:hypothetical protein